MKYAPKTEKEIDEMGLWPADIYPFEVLEKTSFAETEDAVSKSGNEMMKLVLMVWSPEGHNKYIIDYITEAVAHKLRHIAYATGLGEKYETGELYATDFVGKTGSVKLYIKKDKDGQYADQNAVADYIVENEAPSTATKAPADLDDEIPF